MLAGRFFTIMLTLLLPLVLHAGSAHAADGAQSLADAYYRTGYALFEKLAGKSGNAVISPYSIGSAMTMATAGARGKTADEMVEAMHLPAGPQELGDLAEALDKAIGEQAGDEEAADEKLELSLANALHLTRNGDTIAESYQELLKTKFGAEIFTGSDLDTVNGWVADKTHGRIKDILTQLDPLSVCVLLNAVYFKAGWAYPFRSGSTAPADFHLSAQETVQVPTMKATASLRVIRKPEFDAISLPYKGKRFAFVVIQPKQAPETAGEVDLELTHDRLAGIVGELNAASTARLELTMPKFKTEYDADLVPPFGELGMKRPFERDTADFSGMLDSTEEADRIHISQIRHKAFIEVDENGTEAAAATAVVFATRALPAPPLPFAIDRPFLYLIVDTDTGAVLFLGRVSDPRA